MASASHAFSLHDFYLHLKLERIILCYCGPIAQYSIEGFGKTLRKNLELEDTGNKEALSVFSVFIEQVQNMLNYSSEKLGTTEDLENELRIGIVVIGREEQGNYFVYCGNRVENKDIGRLQDKLDILRSKSKEELKAMYKAHRRKEPEQGSKGAGLGLIEMARKAGRPIEYTFTPIDHTYSFFCMKVVVDR